MKSSEVIFAPNEYMPFKRRVRRAFRAALTIVILLYLLAVLRVSTSNILKLNDPSRWAQMGLIFLACLVFFFFLAYMGQIRVLDSIIIDKDKRTVKVLIRKYDEVLEKGEYTIDRSLSLILQPRSKWWAANVNCIFTLSYNKKQVWTEKQVFFLQVSSWNYPLFKEVKDAVDQIQANSTL